MSDIIVIQPTVTELTVTEDVNQVVVSGVGVQGPAGATGATGAKGDTGDQGPSGVVTVNAPLTNAGTSSAANLSISAGTTSAAGALQLTDSVASTSTTTAATPNAVKTAYDFVDTRLLKYGTPWQVKYRSGNWYEAKYKSSIASTTITQYRAYLWPLFISESITIDRIGVECTTATASTTWRIGIYNSDSNGLPSTVLLDAGTVDTSTTGLKTITVSQTLSAGLYFVAGSWQTGFNTPTLRAWTPTLGDWTPVASTTQQSTTNATQYQMDSIFGAFPTFSGSTTGPTGAVRTQFRIA
jgi:hypothetical protein